MIDKIINQVKEALSDTLKLTSSDEIKPTSKLKEELGLDSMSSLTFLMALEDRIPGFVVDPDSLETDYLDTVESVASYVSRELGKV